jgi:hypothetical protein
MAMRRTRATPIRTRPDQKLADTSCGGGCGGKGQEQNLVQTSKTKQDGQGNSKAKQKLVNVTPVHPVSRKGEEGRAKAE